MSAVIKSVIKSVESWTNTGTHHTTFYVCQSHMAVFDLACAGACKCNCMPFPSRPEEAFMKTNCCLVSWY